MSFDIWTQCAGASEIVPLEVDAWRVVESQHQIATRRLVATDAEQALLEELIDEVKPPDTTGARLHYLLYTPFRYPPLTYGSRFGGRHERALWYGSETLPTAFAEVAYYRLLFLEGTAAELGTVVTALTAFRALLRTDRGVDLTAGPFAAYRAELAAPDSYAATQRLGTDMRAAGVHAFRYVSARDAAGGVNVAAYDVVVFGRRRPHSLQTWHCTATRQRVELMRRDYFGRASCAFDRAQFEVGGRLPAPAV